MHLALPPRARALRRAAALALTVAVAQAALTVTSSPASAAATDVPTPTVTGPVPVTATSYPFMSTEKDLERYGYIEEEFFLSGTATEYSTPTLATGSAVGEHPYATRVVVRRPASAKDFSGTVVLEWTNVTAGYDLEFEWFPSNEHFLRSGYAWVGVSAQRVGVDALRAWNPDRYGALDVTDGGTVTPSDALSYDIYSQAAQAVRSGAGGILGDLRPETVIAGGHSQSASRLALYHNSVHPLHQIVDGFIIHGSSAALRKDLETKVIRVMAEGDVRTRTDSAEADTENFRRWEVAGTSHVGLNEREEYAPLVVRDRGATSPVDCERAPFSRVPFHYVLNAAYEHLVRWIEEGIAPPTAPRLEWVSETEKARDADGNALGGIRLPQHAVPTAVNTGDNSGAGFCRLYGSHTPFDQEKLSDLYPNHGVYVSAVNAATNDAVRAGFLLTPDAQETRRAASASAYGIQ